jgi:hypothetical protein
VAGAVVCGAVLSAARSLRDALAGFEPGTALGTDCAVIVEEPAATEKACAAARAAAAVRAVACGPIGPRDSPMAPTGWPATPARRGGEARMALATATGVEAELLALARQSGLAAVRDTSTAPPASTLAAADATGWSGTTSTPSPTSPTVAPPPTTTSSLVAGPTTKKNPSKTVKPASSPPTRHDLAVAPIPSAVCPKGGAKCA